VILGLELESCWSATHACHDASERYADTVIRPGTRLISIGAAHLYQKANYQDFQRFQEIDLVIPADAEATLPYLVEAVRRIVPADRKDAMAARGERLAAAHRQMIKTIKDEALYGWQQARSQRVALPPNPGRRYARTGRWGLSSSRLSWHRDCKDATTLTLHRTGRRGDEGWRARDGWRACNKGTAATVTIKGDGDLITPRDTWTAHRRLPVLYGCTQQPRYHQERMVLSGWRTAGANVVANHIRRRWKTHSRLCDGGGGLGVASFE
jgi:hypothetical protein